MPQRNWKNLPEAQIISDLLREAPRRVSKMKPTIEEAAIPVFPFGASPTNKLQILDKAIRHCTACALCSHATQPVFGAGPSNASIMLIGEQPGDEEDLCGKPFVGPAGILLDRALAEANIDRNKIYVTNAVKHFKFEQRGKRPTP